jgi:hypothetical protein
MTSHPTEVQFRVPPRGEEKTLFFLCSRCQEESINMCKTKVLGTKAGEKILIEDDEQGDVDGVKDAIGDELEDIVLNHMLPKCGTCGVDFLAYQGNIAMVGSVKHHQECWETGKPGAIKPTDRKLDPSQAVKYLPERIIVRLTSDKKPIATVFFVWNTKSVDLKRIANNNNEVVIRYGMDDQAFGNPNYVDENKRKTRARLPAGVGKENISCELVGDPLGVPMKQMYDPMKSGKDKVSFQLGCSKFHSQHDITLQVPKQTNDTLDLSRARLSVNIHSLQ